MATAVWNPTTRMWDTQASMDAFGPSGEPTQQSPGMGEGFDLVDPVWSDNFGRTYTQEQNYIGGEGATNFVQTQPYSGIMGEGNPMPGELAPVGPGYDAGTKTVKELLPENFYTGNIDEELLNRTAPGDARWDAVLGAYGSDFKRKGQYDYFNQNNQANHYRYFSTLQDDYAPKYYGIGGQNFNFIRGETDSIWGSDTDLIRNTMVEQIAPALQATYEETAMAALQARDEFKQQYGQYWTEATSPLDVIQMQYNKLADIKGITDKKQLFSDEELAKSRQMAQDRQDQLKKMDEQRSGFAEVMKVLKVPMMFAGMIFTGGAISSLLGTAGAGVTGIAGAADLGGIGGLAGADAAAALPASMGGLGGIDLTTALTTGYKAYGTVDKILNWDGDVGGQLGSVLEAASGNDVGGTAGTIEDIQNTATTSGTNVANKVSEFFGGGNPFQSSGKKLQRLSTGSSVFGPSQGVIAEYDNFSS